MSETALSRRSFAASAAAAIASPALARAAGPTDVDVAIVGAGAAGLAAALDLRAAGRSALILEARSRIGGRAFTESARLGLPYDHGAHWLHSAHVNPFVDIAKALGRETRPSPTSDLLFTEDGRPSPREAALAAFDAAGERVEAEIGSRLALGDFPMAAVEALGPWERTVARVAAFTMATDSDRLSAEDFAGLEAGDDLVVEGGYGALVAAAGREAPVRLGAAVSRIRWGEAGRVTLEGAFGALSARACIVTAPPAVLAAGGIAFDPPLPPEKAAALAALEGGRFMKTGLRIARPMTETPEYVFDMAAAARGEAAVIHLDRRLPLATVIVAGRHAAELADAGATEAHARETLAAFAPEARIEAATTTDWSADPFAMGAYSVVPVGGLLARAAYAEPVAERLFFAGEAAGGALAVTVAGAHLSGIEAARAAARAL